jgi:hypothetical protein
MSPFKSEKHFAHDVFPDLVGVLGPRTLPPKASVPPGAITVCSLNQTSSVGATLFRSQAEPLLKLCAGHNLTHREHVAGPRSSVAAV